MDIDKENGKVCFVNYHDMYLSDYEDDNITNYFDLKTVLYFQPPEQ